MSMVRRYLYQISQRKYSGDKGSGYRPVLVDEKVDNVIGMEDVDHNHGIRDVTMQLVLVCGEREVTVEENMSVLSRPATTSR
jgi:hypothetical protein